MIWRWKWFVLTAAKRYSGNTSLEGEMRAVPRERFAPASSSVTSSDGPTVARMQIMTSPVSMTDLGNRAAISGAERERSARASPTFPKSVVLMYGTPPSIRTRLINASGDGCPN